MADNLLHIGFDRTSDADFKDRKFEIPLASLKRHFAAIGSSGSGKTVLVKCIMEEAVRKGIPLLLIDLQGDLASLAIMGGDTKSMESKGTPISYWQDYKDKAQVAIFTPASAKGISISMNPLKAPPENLDREDMIQAIDSVATTVASILHYKTEKGKGADVKDYLFLMFQQLWKKKKSIKSFDELADYIKKDEDFLDKTSQTMIDEKTKFELAKNVKSLTIGAESLIFNLGMPLDVKKFMTWTGDKKKVPVNVLYLNTLRSQTDKVNFIADTATQVYNYMLQNPSDDVQLIFVLDELAGLVPPTRAPASKRPIQLLLKQARKYGVSLLLATQNISDVDYKSLGQVGSWALGRLMSKQDIDKVKDIIEAISPAETDEILSTLSRQKTGQFMILAPDTFDSVRSISARWLVTDHKTLDDKAVKKQMDISGIREKFPEAIPKDDYVSPVESDGSPSIGDYDEDVTEEEKEVAIPHVNEASELTEFLDNKPLALSAEDLSAQTGNSVKESSKQLNKLVGEKKLKVEDVNGVSVYWSPKHKMDPKNNIIGPLYRFRLKFPQHPAKKIMKSRVPATLGLRKKAEIIDQKLVYVPLWRINGTVREGEKRRFRKDKKAVRGFYFVNGKTGGVLDLDEKEKEIHFPYSDIDPEELRTFDKSPKVEAIIIDDLDDKFSKPNLNRQHALGVSEEYLGLVINKKVVPSIVWMPFWEFTLQDKDTNAKSKSWIDGHFGHLIPRSSPIDDEDSTEAFFNI